MGFQPYPTPMLKNADYVGKTTDIVVPVCCNYILSKYLMGLNVEVATRMRYYTNILLGKNSVRSSVVYSVSVSCCNNDNSGLRGGVGV